MSTARLVDLTGIVGLTPTRRLRVLEVELEEDEAADRTDSGVDERVRRTNERQSRVNPSKRGNTNSELMIREAMRCASTDEISRGIREYRLIVFACCVRRFDNASLSDSWYCPFERVVV